MKNKYIVITSISLSLITYNSNSYATIPVVDAAGLAQMVQEYAQLLKIYTEMQASTNYLSQLNSDSLKWMSLDFTKYFNSLKNLQMQIEKANNILSTNNTKVGDQFNNLYPGYDSSSRRNYTVEFINRSNSLLKILQAQISAANEALSNQKDINTADKSSATAVANLTLASLSNLNTLISSEIRSANAYRASQTQNEVDKKIELQKFIGKPYKKHDSSKYKTCVGEC